MKIMKFVDDDDNDDIHDNHQTTSYQGAGSHVEGRGDASLS